MKFVVKLLEEEGYAIDVIDGVDKLKNSLQRKTYDLILLDIMMPPKEDFSLRETHGGIITGKEVFYRIIREKAPQIPVIVITALSDQYELGARTREELEKDEQIRYYFIKPVDMEDLIGRIGEII